MTRPSKKKDYHKIKNTKFSSFWRFYLGVRSGSTKYTYSTEKKNYDRRKIENIPNLVNTLLRIKISFLVRKFILSLILELFH